MDEIRVWLEEIKSSKKREKDFRSDGDDILEIYDADKKTPFNILFSNTETMLPALFSELPRPVIQRRFHDEDPLGKVVSQASQRMLEYLIDTDIDEYDKFSDSIEDAVFDALVPGRGITSVKYEAEVTESDIPSVEYETVCVDSRVWNRVYFGYAKKWSKMPWLAYEEYLDKDECIKLFGEKVVKELNFTEGEEDDEETTENEEKGKRKTVLIYQIWDKTDRKVKYITPQYKDNYLKVQDDPLGLNGFFNMPEPLRFIKKSKNFVPTAPYKMYENQAEELNRIQRRLNRVIEAIKARGAYDGQLGEEIANILKEDDNALIPTDNGASLVQGGLSNAIWFLPIEKMIVVAQQLIQARESCKQVIYEITGISDIVRGQSAASETLGAQKIKQAWGTMRLKRLQKLVQYYALDMMKIMLEIASTKFSEKSWKQMTQLPFPTSEEKEKAVKILTLSQQQGAQPDPELMKVAQKPSWGEILEVLKNDLLRSYRIDIETNSTLDVEATEDKQLVAEFMNAMAQFMNGVAPLVEKGAMSFEVAQSMMMAIVRRYRFGRDVEDQLKSMQPPKPGGEEAKKLAQERQKFEQEKEKAGKDLDQKYNKLQMEEATFNFQKQLAKLEQKHGQDLIKAKQQMESQKLTSEFQSMLDKHMLKVQSALDKQAARMSKQEARNRANV